MLNMRFYLLIFVISRRNLYLQFYYDLGVIILLLKLSKESCGHYFYTNFDIPSDLI